MLENLIKEISKKYNLDIKIKPKLPKVYTVSFKLENNEVSFIFMCDSMKSFEENLKELEKKVNDTIIEFYRKKKGI